MTDDIPDDIPDLSPVPLYYWHLSNAQHASKEMDYFDLREEDPASKAEWDRLCAESSAMQKRLIEHVLDYSTTLLGKL